ncbi:MAG: undecaprenyl/decaprenyl-phosphate alpha-N-acetylglucosaminyl 1-phosphate transferase [Flavobacteriales bacterium]|nr:undecaprenyl/decaprenyl-phosphate alpha-N-acetylglucosaminyl 1-phosphate transferase [Flavobacteriales bacterium]
MKEIILGCITSFFVVLLATPSLITVAKLKNLVDEPDLDRKHHKKSVPTIGGIIIFAASIFAYALWFPWDNYSFFGSPDSFSQSVKEFKYLIASAILIFFIGVKDDIIGVAPVKKLIGHSIVGFILVIMADIRISGMHGVFGIEEIPYYASVLLSVFTYIVVVNAFNLIDGSDGLAAGIGLISSVFFGVWFYLTGQYDLALLSFVLVGALQAFLIFNFAPAKIYMGDSGSLFIGAFTFALAVKCIETDFRSLPMLTGGISPAVFAMSVLAYPLIDTLRVFALRIFRGVSPFEADRQHIHHRIIDGGYSHRFTALILYAVSTVIPLSCLLFGGVDHTITFFAMLVIGFLVVHAVLLLKTRNKDLASDRK